jgi:hypothetical protein
VKYLAIVCLLVVSSCTILFESDEGESPNPTETPDARTSPATCAVGSNRLNVVYIGDGEGDVSISVAGGEAQVVTCSFGLCSCVEDDKMVTLIQMATAPSEFCAWTGECDGTNSAECTFLLDSNKDVAADFSDPCP